MDMCRRCGFRTGRNFDEILRVIDSLQLTAKHRVATPGNWMFGQDVIIAGSVSDAEAATRYPQGWAAPNPYLRIVSQPSKEYDQAGVKAIKTKILILGAGFGGLEMSTTLSEALGDSIEVTLIDKSDSFVFGYAKLDLLFGRTPEAGIRNYYAAFAKPGVRLLRETITDIDATARRVTTTAGVHEAEILVVALGADYDVSSTPGVVLGVNEFYSVPGAAHMATVLPDFRGGDVVVGICGAPYKCPPAPAECALMLHDYVTARGLAGATRITLVSPLPSPVPPSPDTSKAVLAAFAERGITFIPNTRVVGVEGKSVHLDTGTVLPSDLFLGVPKNRAADVVVAAGITENGWVPVDPHTLQTSYPGVYAVGDLASTGVPKAGVYAEGAARTVAANIISQLRNEPQTARNPGAGTCYIEFGANRIARVDVDFLSGPKPFGTYHGASEAMRVDKELFGSSRRARWFGQ
jgi:sulfide:quinone oxidoreductase